MAAEKPLIRIRTSELFDRRLQGSPTQALNVFWLQWHDSRMSLTWVVSCAMFIRHAHHSRKKTRGQPSWKELINTHDLIRVVHLAATSAKTNLQFAVESADAVVGGCQYGGRVYYLWVIKTLFASENQAFGLRIAFDRIPR